MIRLFLLSSILFVLLFWTPILGTRAFFYRGIVFLVMVSIGLTAVLHWLKRPVLYAVVWFCLMLVFFTHIPVTAERSVSVFLLKYMDANSEKTLTKDQLNQELVTVYINEHKATEKRIEEQRQIGTLVRKDGGYTITSRGRILMQFYRVIAALFHL